MYKKHHIARMFMCRCCNFAFPDKTTMHMHIHAKEEGKNVSIPVIGKGLTASERLLDPSAFNIPPPTTTTTVISPQLPTSNILPSTLSLPYFSPPSISSVSQAPTSNMSSFVLPEEFAKLRDRLVMNSLFSQQGLGMAAAWLSNLPKPIPTTQPTSNMLSMMRQDEDEEIINVDERENDNLMEDKLEGEKMPEELKPLSVEGKRLSDSPSSNASLASGDGCSPAHTSSAHSPIVGLFKKDISTPSAFHHLNVDSRPCLEGAGSSPSHVSPSETHSSVSPDGNCYECQVYKTKLVISENKCRYLESRGNTLQSEAVNAQSQASIVESALRTAEIESVGMKQRNELLHRRLIDCQVSSWVTSPRMVFIKGLDGVSRTYQIGPETTVAQLKQLIEQAEGIPDDEQRLLLAGHQLADDDQGIDADATIHLSLSLLGGGKKRKKKIYTTPKKIKHKKKKVKLAVLKFYKVDGSGSVVRQRKECQSASCGGGVFMAAHENRYYCGRCHSTLVVEEPAGGASGGGGGAKGGKKGKK
ncbi:hypothetical protein WR25_02064 [Diploscapter pachys]|uniref:Ubiquitin-like domain-containing protein n=1 Tax=Diploscapter pachys TaxID=2018661 RepID=A0A2A2LLA4_9BILA|nr:hypothetical protein WR25_02064 [Diploscapter pachys]